jgi:hypothetical protein
MADRPLPHREGFLLIAAAVVLVAVLQLVVLAPATGERLLALVGVLVGFGFVAFVYAGYWQAALDWYDEWVLRRHIRAHRKIVDDLLSVLAGHDRLFGSGRWFLNSGNSLISAWLQESTKTPPVLSADQQRSGTHAHAVLNAWSNVSAYSTSLKQLVEWRIQKYGYFDGYEFYWAARMIAIDLSKGLICADSFVNAMRSAGLERLPNYLSDEWNRFKDPANELVHLANDVGRRSLNEAGVDIEFGFRPVPDLYPRAGESAPRPVTLGPVEPPPDPAPKPAPGATSAAPKGVGPGLAGSTPATSSTAGHSGSASN